MGQISVDTHELEAYIHDMMHLQDEQIEKFFRAAAKELAARLLRKVIKRTPVGQYDDGRVGGTLRRGWTAQSYEEAAAGSGATDTDVLQYVNDLTVEKKGNAYIIEIINPVEYASYVEYGHRTRNLKGFVKGRYMLTISEQEIERDAEGIIMQKFRDMMPEV